MAQAQTKADRAEEKQFNKENKVYADRMSKAFAALIDFYVKQGDAHLANAARVNLCALTLDPVDMALLWRICLRIGVDIYKDTKQ